MQSVKRLRKIKGWSQVMLAEAAGIEQSTISKIENGWDGATLRNLKAIAAALDAPLYQLFIDDTSEAELRLVRIYRSLPEDRRKGWDDMAVLAIGASQSED